MVVSGSGIEGFKRVIKVFYRDTEEKREKMEDGEFEVVSLGEDAVGEIRGEIERWENGMIEKGNMGIWNVGYLPRK